MAASACRSFTELEHLLARALEPAVAEDLAQHLEQCERCGQAMDRLLARDSLAAAARSHAAVSGASQPTAIENLISQFLRRSPSPPTPPPPEPTSRPGAVGDYSSSDFQVPGYELLGELGRGGMGVVYRARQAGLNRLVALKMIRAADADAEVRARFKVEAEAVARLRHPTIVQIYEVGEHQGRPFFSLEYIETGSLAQRLDGTPWPSARAAELVEDLARGVHAAHLEGVVHRDLKPANVLVTADGRPKVADFGLAKQLDAEGDLTQTGAIMGTPNYMAPEQAIGGSRQVGPGTDVWAMGIILYELLTGRAPFRGASSLETLEQVRHQEPVPPRHLQPKLPRDLETICLMCLQKEVGRRYPTSLALADDLRRFLDARPILARPVGPIARLGRWCRRNPVVAGLVGLLALFLLSAAVVASFVAWHMSWLAESEQEARSRAVRLAESEQLATRKAVGKARDEQKARREATTRGEALRRQLSHQYVANGSRALDEGDYSVALLWFAKALELDRNDADRAAAHQLRLANTWRQMPRLTGMYFHDAPLTWAELSPDARRAVTAGYDRVARIWDTATGKQIGEPLRHRGYVFCARFSPDGRRIATASGDATARIWDAFTGKPLSAPLEHRRCVYGAAFSPDGNHLATCCGLPTRLWALPPGVDPDDPNGMVLDGPADKPRAAVWDLATGTFVRLPEIDQVLIPAFSRDGRRVALAGPKNYQAIVCDAATGTIVAGPFDHGRTNAGIVTFVSLSPDAKRLVTGTYGAPLRLWDVATGKQIGQPMNGSRAFFNRNGSLLAGSGLVSTVTGGVVTRPLSALTDLRRVRWGVTSATAFSVTEPGGRVWDSSSGRPLSPILRSPHSSIDASDFDAAARLALDSGTDHVGRLWDLAGQVPLLNGPAHFGGYTARYSPDGRKLVIPDAAGVSVWDATTGRMLNWLAHPGPVLDAAFSPDSNRILTAGRDGAARLWDSGTGKLLGSPLRHPDAVVAVVFDSSGQRAVTLCGGSLALGGDRVIVWDLQKQQPIWQNHQLSQRLHVAISSDGRYLAVGTGGGRAHVLELATGRPVTLQLNQVYWVRNPRFSPDGKFLATCGGDLVARVWEIPSAKLHLAIPHRGTVTTAAFSPEGRWLATGDSKGNVRVWATATGRPRTPVLKHRDPVHAVAFDPTGRYLVAAAGTTDAQMWDAQTGERLGPPLPTGQQVNTVCFRHDGQQVLTATGSAGVYLWDFSVQSRSTEDWLLLARVQSGHRLDDTGSITPLSPSELRAGWNQLCRSRPQDARVSKAQIRSWYIHESRRLHTLKRDADSLEMLNLALVAFPGDAELSDRRLWRAAKLRQYALVIEDGPRAAIDRPAAWLELADAYQKTGRTAEGVQALTGWLKHHPKEGYLWQARGRLHLQLRRFEAAIEDLTHAIERLKGGGPHGARGHAFAETGRWAQARGDFARARANNPLNVSLSCYHTLCLLGAGDRPAFREEVGPRGLRLRFGEVKDFRDTYRMAWILALTPDGHQPSAQALAQRALKAQPQEAAPREALALVHYRAGRYAEAVEQARAAISAGRRRDRPAAWLILALAHSGLKQDSEGRDWYDKARAWLRRPEAEQRVAGGPLHWSDRLALEVLHREAEAVAGNARASQGTQK
jgi:WD40 repeat protein/serine/threonine protein kinase